MRLILKAEGVHKSFLDNAVLRGVDLEIRRGEFLAVVGQSGCGKTVLLEVLIGHLAPDRGRVLVIDPDDANGELVDMAELSEEDLDKLRARTGVVFQQDALYSASVYENIALMLRETLRLDDEEIGRRVRESLEAVGLPTDAALLAKQRDELSGGMRKRVAIARELAVRPPAMVYDDPTAGLDPARAKAIHDLIGKAHRELGVEGAEQTTVVITHDKDLLRRFRPRVVMLHEGKVYFDGPWERFEESDSPVIRPYLDVMPALHRRVRGS